MPNKSLFAWMFGDDEAASEETTRDAATDGTEQTTDDATGTDAESDTESAPEPEAKPEGTEAAPEETGTEPEPDAESDDEPATEPEPEPEENAESATDGGFRMSQAEVQRLGAMFGDSTAAAECLAAGMTYNQAVEGLAQAQANKLSAVEQDLADRDERLAQIAQGSPEQALSGGTENAGTPGPRKDGLNDNLGRVADGMQLRKQ